MACCSPACSPIFERMDKPCNRSGSESADATHPCHNCARSLIVNLGVDPAWRPSRSARLSRNDRFRHERDLARTWPATRKTLIGLALRRQIRGATAAGSLAAAQGAATPDEGPQAPGCRAAAAWMQHRRRLKELQADVDKIGAERAAHQRAAGRDGQADPAKREASSSLIESRLGEPRGAGEGSCAVRWRSVSGPSPRR